MGNQMCDKIFYHCRGWWNVWSKGFITLAGHEKKFVTPEGDEKYFITPEVDEMYSEKVFLL